MTFSSEHGNEHSGYITDGKFLDQVRNNKCYNSDSVVGSHSDSRNVVPDLSQE